MVEGTAIITTDNTAYGVAIKTTNNTAYGVAIKTTDNTAYGVMKQGAGEPENEYEMVDTIIIYIALQGAPLQLTRGRNTMFPHLLTVVSPSQPHPLWAGQRNVQRYNNILHFSCIVSCGLLCSFLVCVYSHHIICTNGSNPTSRPLLDPKALYVIVRCA